MFASSCKIQITRRVAQAVAYRAKRPIEASRTMADFFVNCKVCNLWLDVTGKANKDVTVRSPALSAPSWLLVRLPNTASVTRKYLLVDGAFYWSSSYSRTHGQIDRRLCQRTEQKCQCVIQAFRRYKLPFLQCAGSAGLSRPERTAHGITSHAPSDRACVELL